MSDQKGTSNTIRRCELCKHLKRKCSKECPLAPYFSTSESERGDAVENLDWDLYKMNLVQQEQSY
ncbi:hypothetical protein ACJIZ3_017833 [Penstemon smallii]|uniref:LOB domain-containing protein n=1 Tax=Penstemon smallii TaxID=265156 RepID=A0ABD3SXH2_9LAMI